MAKYVYFFSGKSADLPLFGIESHSHLATVLVKCK